MKKLIILCASLQTIACCAHAEENNLTTPQWAAQESGVKARLRGLSAASDTIAWTSGSNNTVLVTKDGGASWNKLELPLEMRDMPLDFRDIDAVDTNNIYLLSIGDGNKSRIFKTTDSGVHWTTQYVNSDPKGFLDSMSFWNPNSGLVIGDSIDGRFQILITDNGGSTWTKIPDSTLPRALPNEGAFSASGSNIAVIGQNDAWIALGSPAKGRVLHTHDHGKNWAITDTPFATSESAGIFSITFRDALHGVIVGGDYKAESLAKDNVAYTSDGGKTWQLASLHGLSGYRSAVQYLPNQTSTLIAVGPSGADISSDDGHNWKPLKMTPATPGYDALSFAPKSNIAWVSGEHGDLAKLTTYAITLDPIRTEAGPLTWNFLNQPVVTYPATDMNTHATFMVQITNTSRIAVNLDKVEFKGIGEGKLLDVSDDGHQIDGMVHRLSQPADQSFAGFSKQLAPGESSIAYFDISYPDRTVLPSELQLQLTQSFELNNVVTSVRVNGTDVPVEHHTSLSIAPPLSGDDWLNANGTGPIISAHRSTAQSIYGQLHAPEQFAIDFIKLKQVNGRYQAVQGDPTKLQNWFGFGEPIRAAIGGRVVEAVDTLPDQVPVGSIQGMGIAKPEDFGGNRIIIDAGHGRYVLYAHLQAGSVKVKLGQTVTAGQLLGKLGNSGNSDGPHLHFQVTNSNSVLNTTALPFVFDKFGLQRHLDGSLDSALGPLMDGTGVPTTPQKPLPMSERLPLTLDIVNFRQ